MKASIYILLLAGIYPYQAQALISEALDTASAVTSDTAHSVSDTAGDVTDVALDASVGTVQRVIEPRYATPVVIQPRAMEQEEVVEEPIDEE